MSKTKQIALITGAAGFVGVHLTSYLSGSHRVVGTKLSNDQTFSSFLELDVTKKGQVKAVLFRIKPDVIFHLAGFSNVKQSFGQPELCMQINYGGTLNLLAGVKEFCPEAKVLVVGSAEVYGIPDFLPVTEKHPLHGTNPYALSRIRQESLLDKFRDLKTYWTRSFNHTGPGQPKGFVVPDFASQVAEIKLGLARPVIRVGNLQSERDFLDVRDVVRAYADIIEKGHVRTMYNVCSAKAIKISYLLDKLIELSGVKVDVKVKAELLRKNDVPSYYGSFAKLQKDTGWKPRIKIEKTLADSLDYWLKTLA